MFKRRFIPYIVGICVVVLLGIAYLSYVNYKTGQKFKAFMADAQAFNHSIENRPEHSSHDHTHHAQGRAGTSDSEKTEAGEQMDARHDSPYFVGRTPDGDYAYNIAGHLVTSKEPMGQKSIEIYEWLQTGKMTPAVGETMKTVAVDRREMSQEKVVQTVVTPDGKLHKVIVPLWALYEEGDAILQSELDPPEIEQAALGQKPWLNNRVEIDGVWHSPPEEYYSIEDPYERRAYFNKFTWSIQYDISMAEVERQIAAGDLPSPLSESEKRRVDEMQPMIERIKMLALSALPLSDKPPVKVSFLPDGGEDALPGWMRKQERKPASGSSTTMDGMGLGADIVSEQGINEDTSGAPVRSDVPLSPLDPPDMVKSTTPPPSTVDIEKQLTPKGIEAELSEGLSPERFNRAQQLIERYGREEGLRRLRESDPEAARRFERERRPVPSRNAPDGGQSESESKD